MGLSWSATFFLDFETTRWSKPQIDLALNNFLIEHSIGTATVKAGTFMRCSSMRGEIELIIDSFKKNQPIGWRSFVEKISNTSDAKKDRAADTSILQKEQQLLTLLGLDL